MGPTVRRLVSDGCQVRHVDVAREQQLAQQFRVDRVPTFVVVVDGREVERVVGQTSYERLRRMCGASPPLNPLSPAAPVRRVEPLAAPTDSTGASVEPKARAMKATVRLQVEDPKGLSYGTGTIIDTQQGSALIMTCAHIFRDSAGQGPIQVSVETASGATVVPGTLRSCDSKADIALVVISPGASVVSAPVAAANYQPRLGESVFSIGCDKGAAPSIRESRITALNKYQGPPNIEVAGQPIIGRSGGGLFAADGQLIGVCNLADPADNEGIYAALPVLQQNLDKIGLSRIYRQADSQLAAVPRVPTQNPLALEPPVMPERMPRAPLDLQPLQPAMGSASRTPLAANVGSDDTEAIIIFRSKTNPNARSEVFVVDRPARELLDLVARESQSRGGRDPIVLQAEATDSTLGVAAPPRWSGASDRSPIVRGQAK